MGVVAFPLMLQDAFYSASIAHPSISIILRWQSIMNEPHIFHQHGGRDRDPFKAPGLSEVYSTS